MSLPTRLTVALIALVALGAGSLAAWSSPASAQETVTVDDFYFCSESFSGGVCETAIAEGSTVTWTFAGSTTHTTTSDDGVWDSGNQSSGTFSFTFDTPGTFAYHCNVHPDLMQGRIVVEAAQEPTATEEPGDGAEATATPPLTDDVAGPPKVGGMPSERSSMSWWVAATAAGLAAFGAGAAGYALARQRRRDGS